jgi:hypothetical protein
MHLNKHETKMALQKTFPLVRINILPPNIVGSNRFKSQPGHCLKQVFSSFLRIKRPELVPASNSEVRNEWIFASTIHYVFMLRCISIGTG